MRHAVYAGSFDPITNGHMWMIENGSRLFDQLTVAIGINPDKKYRFPLELRLQMLRESIAHLPNVHVADFENLFLVHYARQIKAGYILRGIRNEDDYGYERSMRYVNGEFDPSVTSVFLMPPREHAEISSSFVKGLVGPAGWQDLLSKYVPPCVYRAFLKSATGVEPTTPPPSLPELVERIRPSLEARYAEPHRHYHTLKHIRACLMLLDSVRDLFQDADAATIAIWFHDAVYDPTRSDNEEASANLAARVLAEVNAPTAMIDHVRRLIMATRHTGAPADGDAARLIDIDLAILAAEPAEFDRYEHDVRQEYSHVSEAAFRSGRATFLERLMARPKIFQTEPFHSQFEEIARANLTRSIAALKS